MARPRCSARSAIVILVCALGSRVDAQRPDSSHPQQAQRLKQPGEVNSFPATYDIDRDFTRLIRIGNITSPADWSGATPFRDIHLTASVLSMADSTENVLIETWYVAACPATKTVPYIRVLDTATGDSSTTANVAIAARQGYTPDAVLGYAWKKDEPGLTPVPDIALTEDSTVFKKDNTLKPIELEATVLPINDRGGFAYQRFALPVNREAVIQQGQKTVLENAILRAEFNAVWGNALMRITHDDGTTSRQIVVDDDIGALVQTALWHGTDVDPYGTCCLMNPTEAGGTTRELYSSTALWAGSPVLSAELDTASEFPSLFSIVRPLNFYHDAFEGTDTVSPLLWRGRIGKRTTLGVRLDGTHYDDVITIELATLLDDKPASEQDAIYDLNQSFWLRASAWGGVEGVRIQGIDLATGVVSPWAPPLFLGHISLPIGDTEAVMLSNADGSFSAGFYRGRWLSPGETYRVSSWCWGIKNPTSCPLNQQVFVVDVHAFHLLSESTVEWERASLVLGTRSTVIARLRQLCKLTGACA